jgi:hypothetical protein
MGEAKRLRRTRAYHEAGHAVAAHVLGFPTRKVTLSEASIASPLPGWEPGEPEEKAVARMADHLLIALAGPAVSHRLSPQAGGQRIGGASDYKLARKIISLVNDDKQKIEATLAKSEAIADAFVEEQWPANRPACQRANQASNDDRRGNSRRDRAGERHVSLLPLRAAIFFLSVPRPARGL